MQQEYQKPPLPAPQETEPAGRDLGTWVFAKCARKHDADSDTLGTILLLSSVLCHQHVTYCFRFPPLSNEGKVHPHGWLEANR